MQNQPENLPQTPAVSSQLPVNETIVKPKSSWLIWTLIVVGILIICGLAYYIYKNIGTKTITKPATNTSTNSTPSTTANSTNNNTSPSTTPTASTTSTTTTQVKTNLDGAINSANQSINSVNQDITQIDNVSKTSDTAPSL